MIVVTLPMHTRSQRKSFVKSTMPITVTRSDILDHTSRMCITPSYNNILKTLEELSKDAARKLEEVGKDPGRGLDLVFDNVQTYARQWEKRIGREDAMKVGMAATAVEIDGFKPEVVANEGSS